MARLFSSLEEIKYDELRNNSNKRSLYALYTELSTESLSESIDGFDILETANVYCVALEEGYQEVDKLLNVYNTYSDRSASANYSLAMESIDNLFGDSKEQYLKSISNTIELSKEGLKDIIQTIINKIKEIFGKVVLFLKKLYIKFMIWWKDYEKELDKLKDKLLTIVGDRLLLVQNDTLTKIEKLANTFLILYRQEDDCDTIELEKLLTFMDQSDLLDRFIDKKKFEKFIEMFDFNPDLTPSKFRIKYIHDFQKEVELGSLGFGAKLYFTRTSGVKAALVHDAVPVCVNDMKLTCVNPNVLTSKQDTCVIVPSIVDVDLNYESNVKIINPAITKDIINNVYKIITGGCIYNIKKYVPEILKYQDILKKRILDASKGFEQDDSRNDDYCKHALNTVTSIGSKLPISICSAMLYNTKIYVKILKMIASDLEDNNSPFEVVIDALKEKYKLKECELKYVMGFKEFPYIHINESDFQRISGSDYPIALCVPNVALKGKMMTHIKMFGQALQFPFTKKMTSGPSFILYNHNLAKKVGKAGSEGIPEYFYYFHELGHCLLNQQQTIIEDYTKTGILKSGAFDKLSKSIYTYKISSYDANLDYALSSLEVEANIFACLMTGWDINNYIEMAITFPLGTEIGKRYKEIVKKKLPYIEKMIPLKFRFFNMIKP